jgi:hypothetical protein
MQRSQHAAKRSHPAVWRRSGDFLFRINLEKAVLGNFAQLSENIAEPIDIRKKTGA